MKNGKKPRVALFGIGTLGGSRSGQGIPVIAQLFERLANHYDITFYSFTRVRVENIHPSIRVRQILGIRFPWRIKFFILFTQVLLDHLLNSYTFLFSVSVYPGGLFAWMVRRIIRRPLVVQLIASEATQIEGVSAHSRDPKLWKTTKLVCAKADYLVAVADYQRKLALQSLSTSRKIDVLPLRVDPSHFIYKKREITFPVQFIQVAFYGVVKDQDTMFKGFAKVAKEIDCHLTVIGFGFDIPHVATLLQELSIADKVTLKGFVSQADLPSYYDKSQILLHTARFESGCAVIQEAMASGVAVCGTDVGILADIGSRYAVVFPTQDPTALAEGVLNLVSDKLRYETMTQEAYQWILKHDAIWSYENYKLFFDDITTSQRELPG